MLTATKTSEALQATASQRDAAARERDEAVRVRDEANRRTRELEARLRLSDKSAEGFACGAVRTGVTTRHRTC